MKTLFLMLILLPAVMLISLKLFTDWKVAETERQYPPQGQFISVDGLKLHYVRKGKGKPVVLVHGSYGSLYDYTLSIFDKLAEEYDVIIFDRPGHGYSERPKNISMTPQDHARILRDALKQLGIEKPLLAGHSYAGSIVLAYAVEYPQEISAAVLIGGYVTYFEGPADLIYRLPAMPIVGKIFLYALLEPIRLFKSPVELAYAAFYPNSPAPAYAEVSTALAMRPCQFAATAEDIRNFSPAMKKMSLHFGEIKIPVEIVTGDSDIVASPEAHSYPLHKVIPNSKLTVVPDVGHQVCFVRPDTITKAIRSAWQEV